MASAGFGTFGPFATPAIRTRLRLPRTTRLVLRTSLAGSVRMLSMDRMVGYGISTRLRMLEVLNPLTASVKDVVPIIGVIAFFQPRVLGQPIADFMDLL